MGARHRNSVVCSDPAKSVCLAGKVTEQKREIFRGNNGVWLGRKWKGKKEGKKDQQRGELPGWVLPLSCP